MSTKKIIIFLSSLRPDRMSDRVGSFVKKTVEERGMKPLIFDPHLMKFELVKVPLHFMPKTAELPKYLIDANEQLKSANGFVIVSAEYNSTIPPGLTNMMDHFPGTSYRHRPCGLITYSIGSMGGARSMMALRSFVPEFGMLNLPTFVPIPNVEKCFDKKGNSLEKIASGGIKQLIEELHWYSDAINNHSKVSPLP